MQLVLRSALLRWPAALTFTLALAVASFAGCASAPSGPEVLSWRIVDGRDCATAGIVAVEMRTSSSLKTTPIASARCSDGLAPATFTVESVPGSGSLYLDAIDSLGVDLYHGELSVDAAPPATGETRLVTLFAAAAQ